MFELLFIVTLAIYWMKKQHWQLRLFKVKISTVSWAFKSCLGNLKDSKSVQSSMLHNQCQTYLGMLLVDEADPQFIMSVHVIIALFKKPHNIPKINSKSIWQGAFTSDTLSHNLDRRSLSQTPSNPWPLNLYAYLIPTAQFHELYQ